MDDPAEVVGTPAPEASQGTTDPPRPERSYACDRCGCRMYETNCKVICPNCGNRFDCSDLNIYWD